MVYFHPSYKDTEVRNHSVLLKCETCFVGFPFGEKAVFIVTMLTLTGIQTVNTTDTRMDHVTVD